ncbi:hypothetical protein NE619_07720 [Anaerovorax odorimutans]|uniref:Fibronectin type-III domain-containing protein n=1 Tax=Anaerovorax odorimutans TaxID=109327 RepID=A0ABT1RN65_9FIRM|nr:hypothetical protein [Anaerovorax odorimutans]MCQ4636614.1 hypothetical protein [Anaerovorax odorimutans]
MSRTKKHAALIIAMIMAFTVIPGAIMVDTASADTKLSKPKLTNHAASSTSIKNTWKKVKDAKGYEVYRATKEKGKFKKVKTIKSGKTVSWANKKLKKNKNYFYKVRAYQTINGKKEYSKFSNVEWAVPTNAPNWEYSMSSKKKTTNKFKLQITNKSRYKMAFTKDGAVFKDENALYAMESLTPEQLTNIDELAAIGSYKAIAAKKTVKPGKTVTLTYKTSRKVSYSSKSLVSGEFKYNKKAYALYAGWDFGSFCERIQ